MRQSLTRLFAPAFAIGLFASTTNATVILSEDFAGGAVDLNETTSDIGATDWVATPTNFLANGAIGGTGAGTATLAFTPVDGLVYTLDASFTGISGDGNWIPFGFVDGQGTTSGTSAASNNRFLEGQTTGRAWMFARGTNDLGANPLSVNNAFLGDTTGNSGGAVGWTGPLADADGGDLDLRIVLDTTGGEDAWTATWFAKRPTDVGYTEVRGTATLLNETINSVGFGKSNTNVTGTITSFSLTQVPEPSSLALLGLGGLLIARRRRS